MNQCCLNLLIRSPLKLKSLLTPKLTKPRGENLIPIPEVGVGHCEVAVNIAPSKKILHMARRIEVLVPLLCPAAFQGTETSNAEDAGDNE